MCCTWHCCRGGARNAFYLRLTSGLSTGLIEIELKDTVFRPKYSLSINLFQKLKFSLLRYSYLSCRFGNAMDSRFSSCESNSLQKKRLVHVYDDIETEES